MLPLLLLWLPLLWRIECIGAWESQAGAGAPTKPRSPLVSQAMDDRHQLQVQNSVTVQESLCVFIRTISYPPDGWNHSDPVLIYWFWKGANNMNHEQDVPVTTNNPQREVKRETEGRFQLLRDPQANNCSLHITGAQKEDSGEYIFRLERGRKKFNYKKKLTVNVTDMEWSQVPTNVPDIIMGSLESGHPSHMTCSVPWACDKGTPLTFFWTGSALRSQGSHSEAYDSSVITLTPSPQDHGTNLTCRVTLPGARVTTERTVTLNVSYAPQNLTISLLRGNCTELKYLEYLGNSSSLPVLEGESLHLVRVTDSNPPLPATRNWTRGSRLVSPSQPSDTGVLEPPRVQKDDEGEVTCRAENRLGRRRVSLRFSALWEYAPQLFSPSCSWEAQDLRCSCSARAWPAPSLHWRVGDHLMEGNSSNSSAMVTSRSAGPWANSSLSLRAGLSPGLGIGCEARNDHGAHSVTVLLLPGKPQCEGGFLQAAILGAGVASTLFLCPCLIFLMAKTLRRKKTKTAAGGSDAPCHHCVGSPAGVLVRQLPRQPTPPDSPPLQTGPLHSGEVQEYQYASLVFHGLRPREPQGQEVTSTTEYSEIRVRQ
ncbi:LOW QUALITY PROTEIN: sialic acid-binding Ig-like lectin 5 [Dugong dugon]